MNPQPFCLRCALEVPDNEQFFAGTRTVLCYDCWKEIPTKERDTLLKAVIQERPSIKPTKN